METNGERKHLINGVSNASNRCQLRACSHLSPPENGRFSGVCSNLFNSACGIHCNSGFELHGGSPVRICLPNGQWSGTQPRWKPISNIIDLMHFCAFSLLNIVCLALYFAPHYLWFIKFEFCIWKRKSIVYRIGIIYYRCIPKKCRMLRAPRNGEMICSHNSKQAVDQPPGRSLDQVGAHCQFSCQTGYRLVGSPSRFCLPVALWTGLPAYCKRKHFQDVIKKCRMTICSSFFSREMCSTASTGLWCDLPRVLWTTENALQAKVRLCLSARISLTRPKPPGMHPSWFMDGWHSINSMHW